MHAVKLLVLMSLFLATACASANYQATAHGYSAFEAGKLQQYDVVFIDSNHLTIDSLPSVDIVPAGTHWPNDTELANIDKAVPPWRRLEPDVRIGPVLFDAVYQTTKLEPADHLRWIISFNPLVVGIDTQAEEEQLANDFNGAVGSEDKLLIGRSEKLVSDADMSRTIQTLYVQNPWNAAPANAVKTNLPNHPTLADLFRDRPWGNLIAPPPK
jgi:hypothetical protein